jgi:hypothetical protein
MRNALKVLVLVLVAALGLAIQSTASGSGGKDILEFDTMAPVEEPFTGTANAIRGQPGGGLPWELDRARGDLRTDGRLDIRVDGLVLARRAPVLANLRGTNPIRQFRAVVNCLTPQAPVSGQTVASELVPATATGDATIRDDLDLPEDCIAPIVFVTSPPSTALPTGAWFAVTGR